MTSGNDLVQQLLSLSNEVLKIAARGTGMIDLRSDSEAASQTSKVKISFEGVIKLDETERRVTYWDKISKKTSGFAGSGDDTGFFHEEYVIRGIERSGGGSGILASGERYDYDFGKVRELVRGIVEKNGWRFKTSFFKPK